MEPTRVRRPLRPRRQPDDVPHLRVIAPRSGHRPRRTVHRRSLPATGGERHARAQAPARARALRSDRATAACGLVQLRHTVPGSILYSSYWYRSGINRSMTENLHEIAAQAVSSEGSARVTSSSTSAATTARCSTDTATSTPAPPCSARSVGCDALRRGQGYEVINDFFSERALAARFPNRKARVITSIAMFYDLEHPGDFVADIARSLEDDGVWVSEFSYMPTMLEKSSFDTICHEHLEYYSLAVIERLFGSTASRSSVPSSTTSTEEASALREPPGHDDRHARSHGRDRASAHAGVGARAHDREPYEAFAAVHSGAQRSPGAPARATTVGSDDSRLRRVDEGEHHPPVRGHRPTLIDCAADRNPDKWGSETIGTHIPIISEEKSRALRPDYYLVLPWHFLDEFLDREVELFARAGSSSSLSPRSACSTTPQRLTRGPRAAPGWKGSGGTATRWAALARPRGDATAGRSSNRIRPPPRSSRSAALLRARTVADADFAGAAWMSPARSCCPSLLQAEGRGSWVCVDLFEAEIAAWRTIDPDARPPRRGRTALSVRRRDVGPLHLRLVLEHIGGGKDWARSPRSGAC